MALAAAAGVLGICVLISIVFWRQIYFFVLQRPGSFDQDNYQAVVDHVRAIGVLPGETKHFRLSDLDDPKTLHLRAEDEGTERGRGAGNVWAARSTKGTLVVVIETRDLGHAGEFGFAYSDNPSSLFGDVREALDSSAPPLTQVRRQLGDHWWEVYNDLD